jgi:hypothetical protein
VSPGEAWWVFDAQLDQVWNAVLNALRFRPEDRQAKAEALDQSRSVQHMPDGALAPSELPCNVDLPSTLLIEGDRSFSVSLGEPRIPYPDPTFFEQSNDGAARQAVPLRELPATRSGLVIGYQLRDLILTQSLLYPERHVGLRLTTL